MHGFCVCRHSLATPSANFCHRAASHPKIQRPCNPFRQLALAGREATAHHGNTKVQLHGTLDASDWITRSLPALLQTDVAKNPQPDLHIRGDKEVRYERVAQAMAAAQRAGIRKIGFITEPTN